MTALLTNVPVNNYLETVSLFVENFRGDVVGRAAQSLLALPVKLYARGQSEVTNLDLHTDITNEKKK